jgi:Mn-dependent DtxR family transcriptional regulator
MHYLLMLLVSLATVTSFEAIGSILVVAMLIAPAATAQLLVHRLGPMLLVSAGAAVGATLLGYRAAVYWNVSPSGSIAVMAGLFYLAAVLLSPTEGILSRILDNLRVALRVRREDVLALLYRQQEADAKAALSRSEAVHVAGDGLLGNLAVRSLQRRGETDFQNGSLVLSAAGARTAADLVRAHRLWETYLVDEVGIQADHVHEAAHVMEHVLDAKIRDEIAQQLGDVHTDPHGRNIP